MKTKDEYIPGKIVCDICGNSMKHNLIRSDWIRYIRFASENEQNTKIWKLRKMDICDSCLDKFKKWVKEKQRTNCITLEGYQPIGSTGEKLIESPIGGSCMQDY